jgi:hypothetical protein
MQEDPDGLPAVGPSPKMLGVRPGTDPNPDVPTVGPSDPVVPGQGGMSVAPGNPMFLLRHRRPSSLGGTARHPVWVIETEDLGPDLQFRQDRASHGLIEPRRMMTLREYEEALAKTRARWKLHCR